MPIIDGGSPSGLPSVTLPDTILGRLLQLISLQIQDLTGTGWPPTVLIPYLNSIIHKIIDLMPKAYPVQVDLTLVEGPAQDLLTTEFYLIEAICNISGSSQGSTITIIPKKKMDELLPNWNTDTPKSSGEVDHVVYDDNTPQKFYVYPPAPVSPTQKVRAVVSEYPTLLSTVDDIFPLAERYSQACLYGVVAMVLAEETTVPNALAKSTMFTQMMMQALGLQDNAEKAVEEKAK
jgi:hypothetical protein